MATPGLWRLSGAQLLEGYARREFSPVEALDEIYERIERWTRRSTRSLP